MGLFGKSKEERERKQYERERKKLKKKIDKLMQLYADEKIDGETYYRKMMELTAKTQKKMKK